MKPRIYSSQYILDETIDTIVVTFTNSPGGYLDELEFGDDINSFARVLFSQDDNQEDASDKIDGVEWIEIVNPQPFMNAESTDEFVINGFNIKRLIREEMGKAS